MMVANTASASTDNKIQHSQQVSTNDKDIYRITRPIKWSSK
ncbi:Uncharacterised protein [Orientia tsutsugamushi]|uniref:Uncharacterized protein n=1 Tax=Orientia tsutsugamushi TaxID=784 RepID=A0A2U3RMC1_ORITS|nr:hypothetical protein [Orientia tsutsugamushi]KJV54913.1 hypothetical protein OTSKARP_0941 [Orientia tsutsugamushi str. Karp]KJV73469.1 hypothetical protein OTSTA763_1551 [Orientia tsutsugamushi str. TA763]SPP26394.1 Uncharacterised protein [Orientia tsutsugamushi]SPR14385.1 Uncharacterised protein [Orientia tsutsugamushi]